MVQVSAYAVGLMALMAASYGVAMPADVMELALSTDASSAPHCVTKNGRKSCYLPALESQSEDVEFGKKWHHAYKQCSFNIASAQACCKTPTGKKCGSLHAPTLEEDLSEEVQEIETESDEELQGKWWDAFRDKCTINWSSKMVCCKIKFVKVCGGLNAQNPMELTTEDMELLEEGEQIEEARGMSAGFYEEDTEAIEDEEAVPLTGAWKKAKNAAKKAAHAAKKVAEAAEKAARAAAKAREIYCKLNPDECGNGNQNQQSQSLKAEETFEEDFTEMDELHGKWWDAFRDKCKFNWAAKSVCCTFKYGKVCGSLTAENPNALTVEDAEAEFYESLNFDELEQMLENGEAEQIASSFKKWAKKAAEAAKKAAHAAKKAREVYCMANPSKCSALTSELEGLDFAELDVLLASEDISELEGKWSKWAKKASHAAKKAADAANKAAKVYCKLNPSKCSSLSAEETFEDAEEYLAKMNWKKWAKRAARGYCLYQTGSPACLAAQEIAPEFFTNEDLTSATTDRELMAFEDALASPNWKKYGKWAKKGGRAYCKASGSNNKACRLLSGVDVDTLPEETIASIATMVGDETEVTFESGSYISDDENAFDFTRIFEEDGEVQAAASPSVKSAYLYAAIASGILLLGLIGGLVFKKVADKTAVKNAYNSNDDKKADLLDNYQDVADVADAPVTMV